MIGQDLLPVLLLRISLRRSDVHNRIFVRPIHSFSPLYKACHAFLSWIWRWDDYIAKCSTFKIMRLSKKNDLKKSAQNFNAYSSRRIRKLHMDYVRSHVLSDGRLRSISIRLTMFCCGCRGDWNVKSVQRHEIENWSPSEKKEKRREREVSLRTNVYLHTVRGPWQCIVARTFVRIH